MTPLQAPAFRNTNTGLVTQALQFDAVNTEALSLWLGSYGVQGTISTYMQPAVSPLPVLVIEPNDGEPIQLRVGDWLVMCDCAGRFHPCPGDLFTQYFTPTQVPDEAPQDEAPDRYQLTNAQVVADLQEWARQNIGHYGNEKPQDVLKAAYMDALELALFLREQIEIASSMQGRM